MAVLRGRVPCVQSWHWAKPSGHHGGHGLGLGLLGGVSASSQALLSSLGGWEAQGTAGRPLVLCLQVGTQAVAPSQAVEGGLRVPTAPSGAEGFLAWLWYQESHGVGYGKPGPQDLYFLSVKKSLRSLSGLCVRPAALLLAAVTCS